VKVSLSNELVQLLSDQLYSSPLKAIEELVVNSYDADARKCVLFVPNLTDGLFKDKRVIVYDDGHGMNSTGLHDLWKIGRSTKTTKRNENKASRKLIGKFGIGKLATSL
jgi:HSP90 family molecular chaperone